MQTLQIVEKLIEKTKNNSLRWQSCDSNKVHLKPLKESSTKHFPRDSIVAITTTSIPQVLNNQSYCTRINNGYFFVLACKNPLDDPTLHATVNFFGSSPDFYSLRIQSDLDNDSTELIGKKSTREEKVELVRLYDLVKSSTSNISSLLEDFLKS